MPNRLVSRGRYRRYHCRSASAAWGRWAMAATNATRAEGDSFDARGCSNRWSLLAEQDPDCVCLHAVDDHLDEIRSGRDFLRGVPDEHSPESNVIPASQLQVGKRSSDQRIWNWRGGVGVIPAQNRSIHMLPEDVRDSHSYYGLTTPIPTTANCVYRKRDGNLRIEGVRIRLSEPSRLLPSGLRCLLPRRGLWRHRPKGEHEQKCCPAVEHGFLRADETGPLRRAPEWVEWNAAGCLQNTVNAMACQASRSVDIGVP